MKFYYLIIILFLSIYSYSQTSLFDTTDKKNFEFIAEDATGANYFWKLNSYNPDSNSFSVWFKIEYPYVYTENKEPVYTGHRLDYLIIYCGKNTYDMLEYYNYNYKGLVVEEGNSKSYSKKIPPGSYT